MIKLPEPALVNEIRYSGIAVNKMVTENLYTEAQLKQAVRDALEGAAKACQTLEVAIDGGGNTYCRPADARQCVAAIRALIEEIPE